MTHALDGLRRNLMAGLRLALFMPVTRLAFRIDLAQLLLLFVLSAAIDVATDWVRFQPDASFSLLGAGGEFFTVSVLVLAAAAQALLFRQRALALAKAFLFLSVAIAACHATYLARPAYAQSPGASAAPSAPRENRYPVTARRDGAPD